MEEGYIKFKAEWHKSPPMSLRHFKNLNIWRDRLYDLGLIGAYENGIGFGNISERFDKKGSFLITGSATGNYSSLTSVHYCLVSRVFIQENRLICYGPVLASSESMSHAVIYSECPEVKGVIHVHHAELWNHLLDKVPATDKSAPYGSPEMAEQIINLLRFTNLKEKKIFVMAGHEEGIFTFGRSLDEAGTVLLNYYRKYQE
jgi:ribulose-5-phosphate 4-epimerase/fuculose-1-phosphate aldolase